MVPKPVITPSVYGRLSSRPPPWARCRASMSSSWKEPSSRRYSIRSRAVILPWACWRSTPRAILPLDGLHVSRSLARSRRRFEVRVNTAFAAVSRACADPGRPGRWITADILEAYAALHRLGWAHSVEAWAPGEGPGGVDLL